MKTTFKIVELIETGQIFLAKPYFLDRNSKYSLFCTYQENVEPIFEQWSLNNEYKEDLRIMGNYETDKINFSWDSGISYKDKT